jgi:hypothetical protein
MKHDESNGDLEFTATIGFLEANCQGLEGQTKNNHQNGKEYVQVPKTPYQNLMLDI